MFGATMKAIILEVSRTSFVCEVKQSGTLSSHSVVKIPGERVQSLPLVQLEDKIDIKEIAIKNSFDYITIPSVQTGRDIQEVRLLLGPEAKNMQIIAKIDSLDAVQNFVSILKQADGVIILRNELQMELDSEKLVLA